MTAAEQTTNSAPGGIPAVEKPPRQSWRYYLSMIRYSPLHYTGIVILRIMIFGLLPQAFGLLQREFFNTLSGENALGFTPASLAAILVGLALAQAATIFADIYLHFLYGFRTSALLRKNLLTRILDRPGAQALTRLPETRDLPKAEP